MPLKVFPYEYRRDLIAQTPGVFIFGDNVLHKGYKGQAVIRGLENSYGFCTKWLPLTITEAYFHDTDDAACERVEAHLLDIEMMLVQGKKVWWPASGIGTGLAEWPKRCPTILRRVNGAVKEWVSRYK